MNRFSSCYFCGTAVNASLSERPVVPPSGAQGDASSESLVLCSTCDRKLDDVLAAVTDAIHDEGPASTAAESGDPSASGEERSRRSQETQPEDVSSQRVRDAYETADSRRTDVTSQNRSADPPAGEAGGSDVGQASGSPAGGADEGEPETHQTVSALENSKVMRMLENREFPVEREAFEHVVANAYDVRPKDVRRVLDMAIDRGLIAEEEGNIVNPP